ncbi:CABIN1 [Mytilus edulis]|uniref:CABIN1 n=1 Tax=Mytilus edulis TaxID=6550 RepID=A0A8S3SUW3_MYTED|nr:CABIN1 [Mytilus edulis]
MIRFAALNYSSSEEDSQDAQERAATKEAEESEAFMLYNRALSLQRQGNNEQTEEAFRELLEHPFITEAVKIDTTEVTVWYKIGTIAKQIYNFPLARMGFEMIFKEDPSLRETTINMFKDCDPAIDNIEIDAEDKEEFINECLKLAEERRQLSKPKMLQMVKLPVPIQLYTWCSLGEALLALYKMLKSSDPPVVRLIMDVHNKIYMSQFVNWIVMLACYTH